MENKVFLIATHNMKKRDELYRILSPLGIDVKTAEQAGVDQFLAGGLSFSKVKQLAKRLPHAAAPMQTSAR